MKVTPDQMAVVQAPPEDDLLVVAGAGSGKTTTMTNRIIALIRGGVPAEQILGLTFTRKAAAELLSRVSAAVAEEGASTGVGGPIDPDSGFLKPSVFTYDAFFQSIVRQYGLLVGMSQDTKPLSDAGAYQLAAGVVADHIDLVFPASRSQVRSAQAPLDVDDPLAGYSAATPGASSLASLRATQDDQDLDDVGSGAFATTVRQVLDITQACTTAMISRDCPDFERAVDRVRSWDRAFIDHLDDLIGDAPIPPKSQSKGKFNLPKRTKKDTDQTYAVKMEDMRDSRREVRLVQADRLRRVARTREKLLTLAEYFQAAKREANMAQFGDFTVAAFQLVTRFPSVGAQYRRRYTHVFLDEYQDTSTTQALLLSAIFHPDRRDDDRGQEEEQSAPAGRGPVGAPPPDHAADRQSRSGRSAVTAVGDPFQSIYAWRGASPGAFMTFLSQFGLAGGRAAASGKAPASVSVYGSREEDHLHSLSQTFRNSDLVLQAANSLTGLLRAGHEGGRPSSARMEEVRVNPLQARDGADRGTVGLLGYDSAGQEIDGVVRFARLACRLYGRQAEDRQESTVAVLFRSKANMPRFRDALEAAGLTCRVVGYSALLDRPEVMDLLALLHLVCDHTDSDSLMRLLASARFNMDPSDLDAFAALASQINEDRQFRALVASGLADSDADQDQRRAAIRRYRDRMPSTVFLVDTLMEDDLESSFGHGAGAAISARGRSLLLHARQVVRQAQAQASAPLRQAVMGAVEALGLDVDLVVGEAVRDPSSPLHPSSAKAAIDAVMDQVDTYISELPAGTAPTLTGFMAWVDAMDRSPEQADQTSGLRTDVELMTIHQAKGLEWEAVAVVGLKTKTFPSNQGDNLKISFLGEDPGGLPRYESTAKTWLDNPTAVPAPVRADADILPRFPHDSPDDLTPEEALDAMDLAALEDESAGVIRQTGVDDQGRPLEESDGGYMTQEEEYGERLHRDERRLAYVAMTRARHDLLITYSDRAKDFEPSLKEVGKEGEGAGQEDPESFYERVRQSASNFWTELEQALGDLPDRESTGYEAYLEAGDASVLPPIGFFAGEHAHDYREVVVGSALAEAGQLADRGQEEDLVWPLTLGPRARQALGQSAIWASQVRSRPGIQSGSRLPVPAVDGPQDDDPGRGRNRVQDQTGQDSSAAGRRAGVDVSTWGLSQYARYITQEQVGRLGVGGDLLERDMDALRRVGRGLVSGGIQSVTSLQALSGLKDGEEERAFWQGVVRPIPRVASPLAQAGTLFHDWARRYILPDIPPSSGLLDLPEEGPSTSDSADEPGAGAGGGQAPLSGLPPEVMAERARMEAELADRRTGSDRAGIQSADREVENSLVTWEERLVHSPWAGRTPAWVERPIVALLDGRLVKGKLDAVFFGGLDGEEGKAYTIVDWKTGRRPRSAGQEEIRLEQLDLYRLLLSRLEGIDLASIDACLYYVSEQEPDDRLIRALPRDEDGIISQLRDGLPPVSDDD